MYVCMYVCMVSSSECIYWSLRVALLIQLLTRVCMWAFKGYYLFVSIVLCIMCVRDRWPFPRDFDFCLLHHYIHQRFDYFRWLDLSISLLIHFIYYFFLWSICSSHGISFVLPVLFFVHIDLHSVFDIFHTSFSYILSIIWYSSFLLFHRQYIHLIFFLLHWYIHIGCPQIHGSWDSLYMLHFIHEGMGFYHWDYWA